jgi:hypothetical protein
MVHIRDAWKPIGQLREIRNTAGCFELTAAAQILHQRDDIDGLLLFAELNHALKNLAMLREEEIFRAQFFDGSIEGMIVEEDGTKDAAFGFEIVRERAFESGIAGHLDSLYFRLSRFPAQEEYFPDSKRCGRCNLCARIAHAEHCDIAGARVNRTSLWMNSEKWKTRLESVEKKKGRCDQRPGGKRKSRKLLFLRHGELHIGGNFAVELDGDFEFADELDGIGEGDFTLVDREALGNERLGDIA